MPRIPSSFRNNLIDRVIRELNPGAEDAIFPRVLEDSAIFVFPGRPSGMEWRSNQMLAAVFDSAAGVALIGDGAVAATGLRYYHAVSIEHNDTAARDIRLEIRNTVAGTTVPVAFQALAPQDDPLVLARPIVIGETFELLGRVGAIGGAFRVRLRTYSANQGLGSELPGL